jgi:hypothetical protein
MAAVVRCSFACDRCISRFLWLQTYEEACGSTVSNSLTVALPEAVITVPASLFIPAY